MFLVSGFFVAPERSKTVTYMHGMSSNYPDATTYDRLGTRAKDSKGNDTQFYKASNRCFKAE